MVGQEKWQWQEPGTAWRGVGVYHVTLTVPSREPLLGTLVIPDRDPSKARIERTALGEAVVGELYVMCRHYPAIRILQFCLMPDHLHAVIQVTRVMETSIRSVIRGYWQGVKKHGRAYSLALAAELNSETTDEGNGNSETTDEGNGNSDTTDEGGRDSDTTDEGKGNAIEENAGTTNAIEGNAETTNAIEGNAGGMNEGGYAFPVFTERPFIRPLSRRGQLHTMIQYVRMNPQRLATKRLRPGYFRVQKEIGIGGRVYDGVGNMTILTADCFDTVHVRRMMVEEAQHGATERLRNYMNSCVLKARKGVVMVSPFISPHEKPVMDVLLREQHPFIFLADNGFREYYKPSDALFDACAAGRVLILSAWPYDAQKRHISRAECVQLNAMAAEICDSLNAPNV
ncbi:MAG: hypothetical protein E7105_08660 [Prevotella sp.]|nr:hypothetical protein [Prevotella sp.]